MKRSHIALLSLAVLAGLVFVSRYCAPPAPPIAASPPQSHASILAGARPSAGLSAAAAEPASTGSPLAAELNAPGGDALHDVQTLHALLRQYLRILHNRQGPPIGDDIDLAHVLTGHNPMHFVFIPPGHPALSADGHIRDRWGTPYFIHPIGYGVFEIRSAGPDRKLFTGDDIVDGPGQRTQIPEDGPAQ